jgi:pimeloyl-ACP methyl ester carboxylesterase
LLQYSIAGQAGEPVVFVQGVGVHGEGWRPQYEVLAEAGYRCLYFDNRGIGRNSGLLGAKDVLTVDQMAVDALAVMDAAGFDRAHLVGHSLGGLVVLRMAQMQPSRARTMALLCTFGHGAHAAPLSWRMIWLGLRSRVGSRESRREGFLGLLLPPPPPAGEKAAAMARDLEPLFGHDLADQPPIVARQLEAMRQSNAFPHMAAIARVPALVMSATHDPIAPPVLGRAIAEKLQVAQFVEVHSASHGLPITHARQVNEDLQEFWKVSSDFS